MKTTAYFRTSVMARRPYLKMEWIEHVLNNPIRTEVHTSLGIYCRDRQVLTGRY
jgi:hypothetical protein